MPATSPCVVLVPSLTGSPLAECEERLRVLEGRGYAVWRLRGFASVETVRSQAATDALSKGFDELMWIDGDVVFNPDDIERLREHDLPMVGGLVAKTKGRRFAGEFLSGTEAVHFGEKGGLLELLYAGLGFLHTRRAVYEAISQQGKLPLCHLGNGAKLVPYFSPMIVAGASGNSVYLEGDFAFGERARQAGFKIVADTRLRLGHIGRYEYSWEDVGGELKRFGDYRFDLKRAIPAVAPVDDTAQPGGLTPQRSPEMPKRVGTLASQNPPRIAIREKAVPLPDGFPRMKAYVVTYPANRESAEQTLANFRQSDWGEEPTLFVQPADWPRGKESASNNYKRALERAVADDCDFAFILEDDVRVCKSLKQNLLNIPIVRRDQCDYLSLYMPDLLYSPWERQEPALGYRLAKPNYSGPNRTWEKFRLWGSQGYLLSRRLVKACLERWDRLKDGQDTRVISVCSELKLPMWYTAPCLVQHAPLTTAFATPTAYAADFQNDFRLEVVEGFQPPEEIPGWFTLEEAKLLGEMARGKTILELGTASGRSTVCLGQRAERVVSIDIGDQSEAAEWLARYGLTERVTLLRGDVGDVARTLPGPFDMAFVDTEHDTASVERDIDAALRLLAPGGLIAFHDYPDPGWPDVRRAVDRRARHGHWLRIAQAGYLGVFRT